jgi:hypothetical protein
MEGEHDNNHKAPQIPESQTGCGVVDFLDFTPIGSLEAVCPVKLELTRRPTPPDVQRGDRAIRRKGDSTFAGDGGAAAVARVIAARRFGRGELIVSDRLTEPRSLVQEVIVSPRQERQPPICPNHPILPQAG